MKYTAINQHGKKNKARCVKRQKIQVRIVTTDLGINHSKRSSSESDRR